MTLTAQALLSLSFLACAPLQQASIFVAEGVEIAFFTQINQLVWTQCVMLFTSLFLLLKLPFRPVAFVFCLQPRGCTLETKHHISVTASAAGNSKKEKEKSQAVLDSPSSCLHFSKASSVAYSVLGCRMNILVLQQKATQDTFVVAVRSACCAVPANLCPHRPILYSFGM